MTVPLAKWTGCTEPACTVRLMHRLKSKAARRQLCTFPKGEAALHPGCHASDQGHLAATGQHHGLPLFHSHIIHICAIAAVVL